MRKRVVLYPLPVRPTPPGRQITSPNASSTWRKHFQHSHMRLFCFVFLNQSGGCAQSGCSCLRDPSRNIWTPSTLVFLPLRTALMRRFLGSFPRTGHSARMHFLSVKITTKKKRAFSGLSKDFIISSSSYRLTLMFVFPVLIHFCSVSLGRGILSTG